MLQLSGTLRNATVRITPLSSWRISVQQLLAASSRATNPSPLLAQVKEEDNPSDKPRIANKTPLISENSMIQAVFDNLKSIKVSPVDSKTNSNIGMEIKTAKSIEKLLSLAENKSLTQDNALAIVTVLLNWVNDDKTNLEVFEKDDRFLQLCVLLSQLIMKKPVEQVTRKQPKNIKNDLNLFYNINEINDLIKDIGNLSVQDMIKVMSGLASKKKRSTPILRALAFNISQSTKVLNIKELSDLLYNMAVLNYADEVLLQKICNDILEIRDFVPRSSVIGSILRSLGTLRYKNEALMDKLSEWVVGASKEMRPQDISSLFLTLAMVGYTPANVNMLNEVLIECLGESDMSRPAEWLDYVWSLTVLQLVQHRHIASVLHSNFIKKLEVLDDIPVLNKQKLLNINGAAQLLMKDYKGPLLESGSNVFNTNMRRSKEKEMYAKTITETLQNMFPTPEYSKSNVDTGMGFLIDAEICVSSQGKRLPVCGKQGEEKGIRIAVLAQYYHDFCRGKQEILGFSKFYYRILEAKNYKVLSVPYTEFSADDKVVKRILYISNRIKSIVK